MDSLETQKILDQCINDISALKFTKIKGGYSGSLDVDPKLFGVIIGRKGSVITRIQKSTRTTIKIPGEGKGSKVSVLGSSCESIYKAWEEIQLCLSGIKTHFLSIPIKDENFRKVFLLFKQKVLESCKEESRIKEIAFRKPHKLHLTLSTVKLSNDNDLKKCVEKINQFKKENEDYFNNLRINFKGVDFWEEDHKAVSCLYSKPVDNSDFDRLLKMGELLKEFLIKEKIILESNDDKMNFHLLLLNKRYVCEEFPEIQNFDLTGLIDEIKDWNFGGFDVEELCLSRKLTGDDENYYTNDATWFFKKEDEFLKKSKISSLDL